MPAVGVGTGAGMGDGRVPAGFTEQRAQVGDVAINYVRGGRGPTLVLLHGYPQCWRMWRGLLPELAASYQVVAPDLRGFGDSDAPPDGYDKLTVAADLHGLLTGLGLADDVRLVGHDVGTMVAYAYAAAHPDAVSRLVLTEAPIPDESIYTFPALTEAGPAVWNFGFFNLTNGLPEEMVTGREARWVDRFTDSIMVNKGGQHGVPEESAADAGAGHRRGGQPRRAGRRPGTPLRPHRRRPGDRRQRPLAVRGAPRRTDRPPAPLPPRLTRSRRNQVEPARM
ncbi:alpha/beta hydrolase [Micromonospora rifamycinica]|uniref:alpha/beta fold hydrolase n=1 Tax=Micromonospora rifamycinica TaxID=291594 RepID=UPI002E2D8968|nr:alpha/beta fold hydrolase [Micromonospora rifamycinica]